MERNSIRNISNDRSISILIGLLTSRLLIFAILQGAIALLLNSWNESQKYWILVATIGNVVSICLLVMLLKKENKKISDVFLFNKHKWKVDFMIFSVLSLVLIPLVIIPNFLLSAWFWDDPAIPFNMLFRDTPLYLKYSLLLFFPVTIVFAELATYFGYIMPRLKNIVSRKWLSLLLPVLFLSIQHCSLPLIFDSKFIIYRGIMYLPFAFFIGFCISKKPELLLYFAIFHGLLDLMAVLLCIL